MPLDSTPTRVFVNLDDSVFAGDVSKGGKFGSKCRRGLFLGEFKPVYQASPFIFPKVNENRPR